jgi:hypothetical protein
VAQDNSLVALVERLNALKAQGLIGEHAIGGAMAFVYVGAHATRVFTPEHAVAIALRTWRGKDREHIDRLIRTGRQPLDLVRLQDILRRFALEERWQRFKEMYDVDLE